MLMKSLKIVLNGLITGLVILPFVCLVYRPFCWAKWYLTKWYLTKGMKR